MMKCKDCKYWTIESCDHPKVVSFDMVGSEKAMVRFGADDCYGAKIETNENFGCVLFEAKK